MKNVTRKDIAEKLGVSVSVVSRVINNSGYVSKEKREKVLKAAKEMGYVQNPGPSAKQNKAVTFFLRRSYFYILQSNVSWHGKSRQGKRISCIDGNG